MSQREFEGTDLPREKEKLNARDRLAAAAAAAAAEIWLQQREAEVISEELINSMAAGCLFASLVY